MIFQRLAILYKLQQSSIYKHSRGLLNLKSKEENFNQRNLYLSSIKNLKLFVDRENQYAHQILEKAEIYNVYRIPPLVEVSKCENIDKILKSDAEKTPTVILEDFKLLAKYCNENSICISNDKFDAFVDTFTEKCHNFSDQQLIESLQFMTLLPPTPAIYYKNFMELWLALDEATCSRIENWELDQVLYVNECWYYLSMARKCNFVWQGLRKFGRKVKKLSKNHMVHSLFFINLVRKPLIEMFDYEIAWKNHICQMSIHEIAVMSMGFFKTKTQIRSPELIDSIYKRLINELDIVIGEDITLVNILKILRYSSRIPQADLMYQLLEKLCPYIDKVSLLSCLHIALLGCDIHYCHDKCVQLIVNRFYKDIKNSRLKDLERITHVMSLYNLPNMNGIKDELCKKILEEIPKRIDEIVLYPQCLATCLHYMTLCGHYNEELINIVLDQRYMKHAYGRNLLLGREVFCLDSFTRIDLSGKYSGNQLTEKKRATMGKLLTNYIPGTESKFKVNATDKILLEVKESCQKIFKFCSIKHILPHYQRPDIVLCYNKIEKKAIKLGENCPDDYKGVILTKDNMIDKDNETKNIETIAIVVGGWNNYVRGVEVERLTGVTEKKLKQLKLLNHKFIFIPWHEWRELQDENDKQKYLRRRLFPLTEGV